MKKFKGFTHRDPNKRTVQGKGLIHAIESLPQIPEPHPGHITANGLHDFLEMMAGKPSDTQTWMVNGIMFYREKQQLYISCEYKEQKGFHIPITQAQYHDIVEGRLCEIRIQDKQEDQNLGTFLLFNSGMGKHAEYSMLPKAPEPDSYTHVSTDYNENEFTGDHETEIIRQLQDLLDTCQFITTNYSTMYPVTDLSIGDSFRGPTLRNSNTGLQDFFYNISGGFKLDKK